MRYPNTIIATITTIISDGLTFVLRSFKEAVLLCAFLDLADVDEFFAMKPLILVVLIIIYNASLVNFWFERT